MTSASLDALHYSLCQSSMRSRHFPESVEVSRGKGKGFKWELWALPRGSVVQFNFERQKLMEALLLPGPKPGPAPPLEENHLTSIRDIITVDCPGWTYSFFWRPVQMRPGELSQNLDDILQTTNPDYSLRSDNVVLYWSKSPSSFVVEGLQAFPEENRLISTFRRLERT